MIFIGTRQYPLSDYHTIHKILTIFITAAVFRVIQGKSLKLVNNLSSKTFGFSHLPLGLLLCFEV
jgi:hypothetical protein